MIALTVLAVAAAVLGLVAPGDPFSPAPPSIGAGVAVSPPATAGRPAEVAEPAAGRLASAPRPANAERQSTGRPAVEGPGAGQPAVGAEYAWPLWPPPVVLAPFDAPDDPFGPGHRGVDLAGVVGQPVLAARAGTVVFAGPVAGLGVVSVQHDDGLRTTYEPVVPVVRVGARVAAGAVIGTLVAGHWGCRSTCLHWGVRRDRLDYVDPLVLLLPPHVRLLPVPEPWPDG